MTIFVFVILMSCWHEHPIWGDYIGIDFALERWLDENGVGCDTVTYPDNWGTPHIVECTTPGEVAIGTLGHGATLGGGDDLFIVYNYIYDYAYIDESRSNFSCIFDTFEQPQYLTALLMRCVTNERRSNSGPYMPRRGGH